MRDMPSFTDNNGLTWEPTAMHFCFSSMAGPYAEIECQCRELQGLKFFIYSLDDHTLLQYDKDEVVDSTPLPGRFQDTLQILFKN